MKKIFIGIISLFAIYSYSQDKRSTKTGIIIFEANSSSAPEEIKAKNQTVACAINTKTGDIASIAVMKSFKFKVALMEEHFNENYVESDKYPKATLTGKIENFNIDKITNKEANYTLNGTLQIHGVSKNVSIPVTIKKTTNNSIHINSLFDVKLEDYKIEVPSIVGYKLAKTIKINVDLDLI